jgi:hypothetical protein
VCAGGGGVFALALDAGIRPSALENADCTGLYLVILIRVLLGSPCVETRPHKRLCVWEEAFAVVP